MTVVGGSQEIVPEWCNMGQTMQNNIHIVVGLDVVQTHNTWIGGMEVWGYGRMGY